MKFIANFHNVSHSYEKHLVIDQVSFDLEYGAITTLIGAYGAGLTTIAKLLLGFEKPMSGTVTKNFLKMAYAPQRIKLNADMPITANNFLNYISPQYKLSPLLEDILDFTNLDTIKDQQINTLSGGQRQRLVLASAILQSPELLVLDEPTQGLDINGQEEFYKLLEKIRLKLRTTIFIISHDLFTVMQSSDQVLCLNHHICCQGRPTHTVVKGIEGVSFYNHYHDHNHEHKH
jgi:zinc transport system ATP-binding protein